MDGKIIAMLTQIGKKLEFIERKMIENEPQEYLTIREACDFAKMSRTTFNELKNDGLIKVYKVRGKVLIKKREISLMIENALMPDRA